MKALLLIDIQNDYFPGGAMPLANSEAAAAKAGLLLAAFRGKGLPIIHVQHIAARPNATFFLPQTEGVNIYASVAPRPGEKLVRKNYPNCFRETKLLEYLKDTGIAALVAAGMMTHMCVDTTVRAAADLGFACQVAHDACATRDLAFAGTTVPAAAVQAAFMAALSGLFAQVRAADTICDEIR